MAGRLAPDHWYANYQESGGRILGEACHFFDFFCFLFGSRPVRVYCHNAWPVEGRLPFPDSISALVEFADGSSGQLIYTAEGDTGYPKETMSVYGAGFVSELTNFQTMDIYKGRRRLNRKSTSKGHAEQMQAWASFLQGREAQPLPYSQARTSMLVTFAALASIRRGAAVSIDLDDPMSLI
jgi:predicted dehydrogenase